MLNFFYARTLASLAIEEGWFVSDEGCIVRDDEAAVFVDDDAALAHVRRLAAAGSALHKAALNECDLTEEG